jgi:hypothetical protein
VHKIIKNIKTVWTPTEFGCEGGDTI